MSEVVDQGMAPALSGGCDAVRIDLPKGLPVTSEVAEAAVARFHADAPEGPRPVILTVTGVAGITREARAVLAQVSGVRAIAVLGESPVDRVLANFVLGTEPLPCPSGFFTSEAQAMAWLEAVCAN
jgi:hypothetical protein